jgi:hypothetical protein
MSRLNQKITQPQVEIAVSANGNVQVAKSAAQVFFETLVGHMYGKDRFYTSNEDICKRLSVDISKLVRAGKSDYVANVILYAREQAMMRSMPILATVYFAKALRETGVAFPQLRRLVSSVIQRADQITDTYAVALEVFGGKNKVPMALKRGVADAMNKFTEYHFGKYNRAAGVTFKDVVRIVHPEPKDENQSVVFKKILEDNLAVPYTWETELSMNGQLPKEVQKSKAQIWAELVKSGKLGYMALLRNLRNIIQSGADVTDEVAKRISDPEQVSRSKQLPFSFIKAFDAVKDAPTQLKWAVSEALDASCANIPSLGKNVWIIVDGSGSMLGGQMYRAAPLYETLGDSPFQTAAVFCAALVKSSKEATNIAVSIFSDNAQMVDLNPRDTATSIVDKLTKMVQGGGTNLQAALNLKSKLGFEPDTVVILSDMEVNSLSTGDSSYRGYTYNHYRDSTVANIAKMFDKTTQKVAVNLASGVSTPVPKEHGFIQLAGFSERIFALLPELRNSEKTVERLFSQPFQPV